MDDKRPKKIPGSKKPYAKPEVKKVHLRPEEAVLGGCKTAGVAGPGNPSCTTLSCQTIVS